MPTEAGRNYPLSSTGIIGQEKGLFHLSQPPPLLFPPTSCPCCSLGVATGRGVERSTMGQIIGVFFRPFLLMSERFIVPTLAPSDGASCRSGLHPTSPPHREERHGVLGESLSPPVPWVTFNVLFLAAPHWLFSASAHSR